MDLSGADNLIKVGKRLQGNINSQINRIEDNKGKEIQGKSGRIPIIPNLKNLVKLSSNNPNRNRIFVLPNTDQFHWGL